MTDFDKQWKDVVGDEFLSYNKEQFAFNKKRVKEFLNNTLEDWKGPLEQIDDILVIGMHIS